jgi:hypothetical protein
MSRNQNSEGSQTIEIDNSYFERVERIKMFGAFLKYQNYIHEHNKRRLNLGNACQNSVQDILRSCFPFQIYKNKDIHNYKQARCFVWVWNLVAHIEGVT